MGEKAVWKSSLGVRISFLLVVLNCLPSTQGLQCYSCRYVEDDRSSQEDCEKDPEDRYLRSVPDPYGYSQSIQIQSSDHNYGYNASSVESNYSWQMCSEGKCVSLTFSTGGSGIHPMARGSGPGSAILYPYCMKVKGEQRGKDVVIRGFAWSYKSNDNDICQEKLPDNWREPGLEDIKACYCNDEDGCNGAALVSLAASPFLIGVLSFIFK